MDSRTYNAEERKKLSSLISENITVMHEIESLREGMKEANAAIAKELDLKPAFISKLTRIAFKNNFGDVQSEHDAIETALHAIGRLDD